MNRFAALRHLCTAALVLMASMSTGAAWAQATTGSGDNVQSVGGPVRLNLPTNAKDEREREREQMMRLKQAQQGVDNADLFLAPRMAYKPSDFELFVRQQAGITRAQGDRADAEWLDTLRRFGADLMVPQVRTPEGLSLDLPTAVPDDYQLSAGDEVLVNIWGSVDANLRLVVDRSGQLAIPRVGAISVNGVRFGELRGQIMRRAGQQFKNFDVAVSMGRVRTIRVYMTGFVSTPGAQSLSGLSTVLQALVAAGGPSAVGSFRHIQLRRQGQAPVPLDLYDLLLKGDRSGDRTLRNEDVIHVMPIGPQVGVIGSVNRRAVYELKGGESLADVLAMAGGPAALANRQQAVIHRIDGQGQTQLRTVDLVKEATQPLQNGDVLRLQGFGDVAQPSARQMKRVRVDGEVQRPGDYILPAGSTLRDALVAAGGLTPDAFLFGTELSRESVRLAQADNYERAMRDLEVELTRGMVKGKEKTIPPNDEIYARNTALTRYVERLRSVRPTGRVVLGLAFDARELPEMTLEDGDRLTVPVKPASVSVYGSVMNSGSYAFANGRSLSQYLAMAGGAARSGDTGSLFVIRADGSVVSNRSSSGWFVGGGTVEALQAQPGDTVFVPENLFHIGNSAELKDWSTILYQFGLGALALKNLK